ncbi:MAG: hypothetical protein RMM30_04020, partial [Armatimonadota bacterium]|nr:hypothetical protein [Armatimonadota bacterium]MDW8155734.1 hypothetical protein [Armatimonadota bacterium]
VEVNRPIWWAVYGVLVALGHYFSYFASVAVVMQVGWAVWRCRERVWRGLVVSGLVAGLLYLPWVPALPGLAGRNPQQWIVRPPVAGWEVIPYGVSILVSQTYGGYLPGTVTYHMDPVVVGPSVPALLPFVVAAGVAVCARGRKPESLAMGMWIGGLLLVVVTSALVGRKVAYARNLLFLQPLAAVTVAAGVAEIGGRLKGAWGRIVMGSLCCGMLAGATIGLQNLQAGRPEFDAYRLDLAAKYLNERVDQQDVVLYVPAGIEYGLQYYLKEGIRTVGLEVPVGSWNEREMGSAAARLRPYLREGGDVWVVAGFPPRWIGLTVAVLRQLEQWNYRRIEAREFLGVQVFRYTRAE